MSPFNFTPFPNLFTERLILRQISLEDENEIFGLRSNEMVLRYVDITRATSLEDARKFIDAINDNIEKNVSIMWGITLKNDNRLIGNICYWNIVVDTLDAEIGYMLDPVFQGKGIMLEALEEVINYGFKTMNLNSIIADIHPENSPSIKLVEKVGFVYQRKADDLLVYSLGSGRGDVYSR